MHLKHLTDKVLLADTKSLVTQERRVSIQVLYHLREIERRRLFSDIGYGSLFDYAVKELGYSEAAALRRIKSARLLAETPEIEKKIEQGSLSLTNLAMASQLFKNEDISDKNERKEILKQIEGTTKKECEKVLMQFAPPKELPSEFQKRITPEFHTIKMNWSDKTLSLYEKLKGLHAHKRLDQDNLCGLIFEISLKNTADAVNPAPARRQSCTRYIPKSLVRYIRQRDKNQCVKCEGHYKLEIDHIKPFALGGKTERDNLRLLCQSCKQRQRIKAKL